jgi:hypothetical protein
MNHFGSLTQEMAARSAFSLYTPYLVIFILTSLATFGIVSRFDYVEQLDFASARAISIAVSLVIAAILAVVLRPVLLSLTGI